MVSRYRGWASCGVARVAVSVVGAGIIVVV